MPDQIITQASFRRDVRPIDQFGRKWFGSIEKSTSDFCGSVVPARWTDPLKTPQQYVRLLRDENGDVITNRCEVQMAPWLDTVKQDETDWYQSLLSIAATKYSQMDPAQVPHLENDPFIRGLAGRKPFPSSRVLEAAMNGDKQYLGLEPLDDAHREALGLPQHDAGSLAANARQQVPIPHALGADVPLPPETYKEFVPWAWKYQKVKSLTEIGAMWKAHQENLKAA